MKNIKSRVSAEGQFQASLYSYGLMNLLTIVAQKGQICIN